MKGVDLTEIDELVSDLQHAGARAAIKSVAVVTRGSVNVMRTARELAPSGPRTRAYPHSITFDVAVTSAGVVGEIGPDKDLPQGPLGNIFEFGTSVHAPQAHLGPALDRENANFERYMLDLGAHALDVL